MSSPLYELLTRNGVHGILEAKDYLCFDKLFSFTCAYLEIATGYNKHTMLKKGHAIYSELQFELHSRASRGKWVSKSGSLHGKRG